MVEYPQCPYCHKRLPIRLILGTVIVFCRFCKREVTVSAADAA